MVLESPAVGISERIRLLPQILADEPDFAAAVAAMATGQPTTFDEVHGSGCALLVAALATLGRPLLIVTPDLPASDVVADDLESYLDRSQLDTLAAASLSPLTDPAKDQDLSDRMRTLRALARQTAPPLLIASIQSLLQEVPSAAWLLEQSQSIRLGQTLDLDAFISWMQRHGFERRPTVEKPGEYSIRGGILDLYAPEWSTPIRVELFGDQVDSLRQFDVATQRSAADVGQIEVSMPNAEFSQPGSLPEYLDGQTMVIWLEPEEIQQQAVQYLDRGTKRRHLLAYDDLRAQLANYPQALAYRLASARFENNWSLGAADVSDFGADIAELRGVVDQLGANGDVHIVTRVPGELDRVREILGATETARQGRLHFAVGCVHRSFRLRRQQSAILGCDQMFHRGELRRSRQRRLSKAIDTFSNLREGDLVVHLEHGIGRYRGLHLLDRNGQNSEHLELEFFGGTRIYVPTTKIDLIQKYIGGTKSRPQLAKVGGSRWDRQKQAAAEAVAEFAKEMLEMQAIRASRPGFACGPDTHWQHEFEQAFPFRETPDQLTAIRAIKADMEQPKPMDRLLCGDVGYGKTEVAMRAAFKAVENGYQVAVLVPTTVLAEQHYRTFRERMAEFPVKVGRLSRFATARQQRETVQALRNGDVDICIGTHRLVSTDVAFCNLGLVVIDEEQRFGVEHKDRLKKLRHSVDVLTMTATPIPRTLHLSLVGVRDISNLETPPENRLPVRTQVTRFDPELIREAILQEMNRGGQVFFVHNRIEDIHFIRGELQTIVPEARIGVVHGQLPEHDIEEVMTEFVHHQFDILLATTIIESGLDIPTANTIFINEAQRYGLAELHQLRGRVGRDRFQAYCYLLLDPTHELNNNAKKRLHAIESYSEMGAGFAIAMRDLEIRGAGNLLGLEQSGHIATVGYELYCQLLERAVRELQRKPVKLSLDVDLDLPIEAYLPDEFIPDRRHKIDVYRRLARVEDFAQLEDISKELADRFGALPPPAERMLAAMEVKLEAALWQIKSIFIDDRYLVFEYVDRGRIEQLAGSLGGIMRLAEDQTAYVTLKSRATAPDRLLALVKSILRAGR